MPARRSSSFTCPLSQRAHHYGQRPETACFAQPHVLTRLYLRVARTAQDSAEDLSLYVIQGTVTEDKNSASHVVYPVPGNLEEGETWVFLGHCSGWLGLGDGGPLNSCAVPGLLPP